MRAQLRVARGSVERACTVSVSRQRRSRQGPLLAFALAAFVAAGCGAGGGSAGEQDSERASGGSPAASTAAAGGTAARPGSPAATTPTRDGMRLVAITHGQASDPFWSIVANGLDDAAADLGVDVDYQAPIRFDMVRMSNLIDAAVASRPSGLILSIPDPAALGPSIRAAVDAGIPTISINSGADAWRELGMLAHIGQTDYEAGLAGGRRLAQAGVTRALCVNHEVGNVSLDRRCDGLRDALDEAGASMRVLAVDLADPEDARQRVAGALASDRDIDGVLTLGPAGSVPALAALRETGRLDEIRFATFDLDPEVLRAIRDGDILFAIDQQPYLQGYLAVITMTKYLETRTLAGGGDIIRTGPSFVTQDQAEALIPLSDEGIR